MIWVIILLSITIYLIWPHLIMYYIVVGENDFIGLFWKIKKWKHLKIPPHLGNKRGVIFYYFYFVRRNNEHLTLITGQKYGPITVTKRNSH